MIGETRQTSTCSIRTQFKSEKSDRIHPPVHPANLSK